MRRHRRAEWLRRANIAEEPAALIGHGGVSEGGDASARSWQAYVGTKLETADTDKGTLKVLIDSSATRPESEGRRWKRAETYRAISLPDKRPSWPIEHHGRI